MTVDTQTLTYSYTAPSGVRVTSCKPEPRQRGPVEYVFWSYGSWTRKIFRYLLTRIGVLK